METKVGYKLCRIKNGKLFPLYVLSNEEFPLHEWIFAKEGERKESGKVKSKLGELAYRPGLHLTDIPFTDWIGKRQPDGTLAMKPDTVWVEVVYNAEHNYTPEARENGWRAGRWARQRAQLDRIPQEGFYYYFTNSKQERPWIIASEMYITRILSNEDVAEICRENGIEPQKIA